MKKICIPKKEMVKEHKRLVRVLRRHKDTKTEADEQAHELKEYIGKATPVLRRLKRLYVRRPDLYEKLTPEQKARYCPEDMVTKSLDTPMGYVGPMTMADINLASWNEFFREGGTLNQPSWLETDRLKEIRHGFERLAALHAPLLKSES